MTYVKLVSMSSQEVNARSSGSQYLLGRCVSHGRVGDISIDAAQPYSVSFQQQLACRSVVSCLKGQVLKKVISPSLALPRSKAFPMLVTPSSITKVCARTQHAPSFAVMLTDVRLLHRKKQCIFQRYLSCPSVLRIMGKFYHIRRDDGPGMKEGRTKVVY